MDKNELEKALKNADNSSTSLTTVVKEYLFESETELREVHLRSKAGLEITFKHTKTIDDLLILLYSIISKNISCIKKTSLISLGGYGRGKLNVRSDLDLMLLYEGRLSTDLEEFTKKILYILWDSGLDVGFSIRNIADSLSIARSDLKTMTALLDTRLLTGDEKLYRKLTSTLEKKIFAKKAHAKFIKDKLIENSLRHEKYGGTVYILEPNVKEGEGGLRDFHLALWVTKLKFGQDVDPLKSNIISKAKQIKLSGAVDFLHRIRNELHFNSKKKNDQLTFEEQERIAFLFGFKESERGLAVELFMQEYYRNAYIVRRLSALIISRTLHVDTPLKGRKVKELEGGFLISEGKLSVSDENIFEDSPFLAMEAFTLFTEYEIDLDDLTMDLVLNALEGNTDKFRESKKSAESFLKILRAPKIYRTMSKIDEVRLLGKYLPEYAAIRCKVQHDRYHVYTVDAHTLFALREVDRLASEYREEFPLLYEIISSIKDLAPLRLGVLFHDVGKALGKGHALRGSKLIPDIARRLGLSKEGEEMVTFLVREHLILADTAQYRDLHDEKLIIEFAKKVGSKKHLDHLFILTFADVRAVGPDVWTDWKKSLFEELYFKAAGVLERGHFNIEDTTERVKIIRKNIFEDLKEEITPVIINDFFDSLPARYYLNTEVEKIYEHTRIFSKLKNNVLVIETTQVVERGYTELVICTSDTHGLFAMICGVLTANSINILGAQINTLKNGITIDVLQVENIYGKLVTSERKIKKVASDLEDVITSKVRVEKLVRSLKPSILDNKPKPKVPTRILIDNEVSIDFTVLEIHAPDKLGLLYDISSSLTEAGFYIHLAKISTKGDEAADIFYISDIFGQKVFFEERLDSLKLRLSNIIEGEAEENEKTN
ncbi:MAG: [protein-PII] uridylyltransferase [Deltaproteobacteria bacterium]|nr:[protein-PII] uridylyltransferase [Deltaproteobacteria bacterium]